MTRPAYGEREIAEALAYRVLRDAPGCVTAGDGALETEVLADLVDALAPVMRRAACAAVNVLWRAEHGHEMQQTADFVERGCLDGFVAALKAGQP